MRGQEGWVMGQIGLGPEILFVQEKKFKKITSQKLYYGISIRSYFFE